MAREAEYLSAGTLDLMYLAVRLAVCELALPDGELCPLIIDDALVNLDEDELYKFMQGSSFECPYYQPYDEYKIVRKQN